MAELKIGGSDVVKIMYGSQEIGGATKLEPGTILYVSGRNFWGYNHELSSPNSVVEITFPNAGKHWEGLKKIRIYSQDANSTMDLGPVFDINSIDKQTYLNRKNLTIRRKRSLTDEPDKLIVTTGNSDIDAVIIEVA